MINLPLAEHSRRQPNRPIERRAPALVDNAERRALLDPIYDNVPLTARADRARLRAEITAELGPPASWDEAERAVKKLAVIPMHTEEILPDPVALGNVMICAIVDREIPLAILWQAVDRAIRSREWFPPVAWMLKTCDELRRQPDDWLRAIDRQEAEHDRRDRDAQDRRDKEARISDWMRDLHSRLARAGDAPSLADIQRATEKQPILHRGGAFVRWADFADQDPRTAAELIQRLALIARAELEPVEHAQAVADALAAAGFNAAAAPTATHRERRLEPEPDAAPRRLGEVLTPPSNGEKNPRRLLGALIDTSGTAAR